MRKSCTFLFISFSLFISCDFVKSVRQNDFNLSKIEQIFDYLTDNIEPINLNSKVETNIKAALKKKHQILVPHVNQIKTDEFSSNHNFSESKNNYNKEKTEPIKENIKINHHHHPNPPPHDLEMLLLNSLDKDKKFWRKLKIPKGTELSLSFQVSRPNVLPGFFFQPEGIVMDAVIEVPITFEVDTFANTVYAKPPKPPPHKPTPKPPAEEEGRILGLERCFLYNQIEMVIARLMQVEQSQAHACILRTICELHSILRFRPHYQNASIVFELIRLFMTPSLGLDDDCYRPYLQAEGIGKAKSLCYNYATQCPINISNIILHNFIPSFLLG